MSDALTLAAAAVAVDGALEEAARRGFAPMAAAVLDAGGRLLCLKRDERAAHGRVDVATAKASGCLAMGFGGREGARRARAVPAFYDALPAVLSGSFLPVPGGVLILGAAGERIGAIGLSGDTADNDEACALAGLAAAGLRGEAGEG